MSFPALEPSAGPEPSGHGAAPSPTAPGLAPRAGTGAVGDGAPAGNQARFPVRFTGRAGEYFRIWIVNVLLSLLTLGVYSAWAKVRDRRYFAGNTRIDGSAFEYHATGLQILVGRAVAAALLLGAVFGGALHPALPVVVAALLALVTPWALWRSVRFNARMTSYRNVRFGFAGGLGPMYLWTLVVPLAPLALGGASVALAVGAGLPPTWVGAAASAGALAALALWPWAHARLAAYTLDGYRYGRARFSGELSTKRFFAVYLKATALALGVGAALVVAAVAATFLAGAFSAESLAAIESGPGTGEGPTPNRLGLAATLASYPLVLLGGMLVAAYFQVRLREHLFARASLDDRVGFESTQTTWSLAWLNFSNLLIRVASLGLGAPWAKVRSARYDAERTALYAAGTLGSVVDDERARQSALGEEIGEAFDMDLDVGF